MFKLSVAKREKKGEKIRCEGLMPAVLYGADKDNISLSIVLKDFTKLYKLAGKSNLIDLDIDNKDAGQVLIQDVQLDPVKDWPVHADLRRIVKGQIITTSVVLNFIGESAAVKELGGTLLKSYGKIDIECLPKDLIDHLDVDLALIKTFDDIITAKDLALPEEITLIDPAEDTIIIKAIPALTNDQIKSMEEGSDVDVAKIESATGSNADDTEKSADDKKKEDKSK